MKDQEFYTPEENTSLPEEFSPPPDEYSNSFPTPPAPFIQSASDGSALSKFKSISKVLSMCAAVFMLLLTTLPEGSIDASAIDSINQMTTLIPGGSSLGIPDPDNDSSVLIEADSSDESSEESDESDESSDESSEESSDESDESSALPLKYEAMNGTWELVASTNIAFVNGDMTTTPNTGASYDIIVSVDESDPDAPVLSMTYHFLDDDTYDGPITFLPKEGEEGSFEYKRSDTVSTTIYMYDDSLIMYTITEAGNDQYILDEEYAKR